MNTLIIYATKHGSSKKCAEMLASRLSGKVDIVNVKEGEVPELSQYYKVILGSSIYAGTAHKELTEFCTKNLEALKNKKLGLYICCMNKKEADKQLGSAFPSELSSCAIVKKNFGGEFRFKEMNFVEKLITKMVSKALAKEDPSLTVDTKKDMSMLSEEAISDFASIMNKSA